MEHGPSAKLKKLNPRLPEFDVKKPDELKYDESFESYLGDKTCISSSGLKTVMKSPLHFLWSATDQVVDEEEEQPDHFRIGSAAHMLILETQKFRENFVVMPEFGPMQSPKNREKRDQWKKELPVGAVILSEKELDDLTNMVESLMSHPQASEFFKNGKPEVTGRFTHKETGIRCRIRPDYTSYTSDGGLYIFDIKTTRMDTKGLFANDAAKKRYDQQLAFYRDGMAQIVNREPQGVALVALEKKPPYSVWVYWMTDEDLEVGRAWNDEALRNLKRAMTTGKWPGPQTSGEMLEMPAWRRSEAFPMFNWD